MIHKFVRYEVRRDALPDALKLIATFVDEVGRKEGGTATYQSFQEKDEPTRFVHYMVFRTPAAEDYHQKTAWCKRFVEGLYPLCVQAPVFTEVERLDA